MDLNTMAQTKNLIQWFLLSILAVRIFDLAVVEPSF